ncbi:hypothetical protein KP509_39G045800 [Ceratopteris richardii]|nr:hypothetical protein KP509_39G045800 [Ceratopteris richardii]
MRLHAHLWKKGLEKHKQLGNYLVALLVEVGHVDDAQKVFDELPYRSECSWNSLIKGYDRCGESQFALSLYEKMQKDGVCPSGYTYVPLLKACIKMKDLRRGKDLHADLSRKGLETSPFVVSTLIDMYSSFGLTEKAQEAFDKLESRNNVSWTALISGYTRNGYGKEALDCFEQMQAEGIHPDAAAYACTLKACSLMQDLNKGQKLHHAISKQKLEKNLVISNALVDMYAKCGKILKAQEIFEKLPVKDVVSWTSLISGFLQQGNSEDALHHYGMMQDKGILPDAATYVCALKACSALAAADRGLEIHVEVARKGLEANSLVGNTLVDMYASCGFMKKAEEIFDSLSSLDVVSWTALIDGYANQGQGREALVCFDCMQRKGIMPEPRTLVCVLKACGSVGAMDKGCEVHAAVKKNHLEGDLVVANALIDMYVKCGSLTKAQKVFDKLPVRDVISWTSLVLGYLHQGQNEKVLLFFERMKSDGIIPNSVTFLCVLHACSHAGLVEKGLLYFEAMDSDYGISPTLEHYSCMVDLLGRAGQLEKAVSLIFKMPFTPTIAIWDSVLAACQKWRNLELARLAFEHALLLNEKNVAAYVTMANIFADAGMEKEASEIEALRFRIGVT